MDFANLVKGFLINGIYKHAIKIIGSQAFVAGAVFLANVVVALSDGVITEDEFHSLVGMASGSQLVILVIIMGILKIKK